MVWEVDAISAKTNSTPGCVERLEPMPFRAQLHKDVSKKDISKFADVLSFIF